MVAYDMLRHLGGGELFQKKYVGGTVAFFRDVEWDESLIPSVGINSQTHF